MRGVITVTVSTEDGDNFKSRYPDHFVPDSRLGVRFLKDIAIDGVAVLVTIAAQGKEIRGRVFHTTDPDEVEQARSFLAFNETRQVQVFYVANRVGPQHVGVPKTGDITLISSIVLDFDPDKSKLLEEERDRLRRVAFD